MWYLEPLRITCSFSISHLRSLHAFEEWIGNKSKQRWLKRFPVWWLQLLASISIGYGVIRKVQKHHERPIIVSYTVKGSWHIPSYYKDTEMCYKPYLLLHFICVDLMRIIMEFAAQKLISRREQCYRAKWWRCFILAHITFHQNMWGRLIEQ